MDNTNIKTAPQTDAAVTIIGGRYSVLWIESFTFTPPNIFLCYSDKTAQSLSCLECKAILQKSFGLSMSGAANFS